MATGLHVIGEGNGIKEFGKTDIKVETHMLRLRNTLVETMDELKTRRILCSKNEAKIRQLLNDAHQMENKHEELAVSLQCLHDERKKDAEKSRRECEKIKKQIYEEKENCCMTSETLEKEVKNLKEAVQSLQLEKYDLESQLRVFSEKAAIQVSHKETFFRKLDEIESKYQEIRKDCDETASFCNKLQKNVEAAVKCNKSLMRVNHHFNCELDWKQQEIDTLKLSRPQGTLHAGTRDHQGELYERDEGIAVLKAQLNAQKSVIERLTQSRNSEEHKKMMALESVERMNKLLITTNTVASNGNKNCCRATQTEDSLRHIDIKCQSTQTTDPKFSCFERVDSGELHDSFLQEKVSLNPLDVEAAASLDRVLSAKGVGQEILQPENGLPIMEQTPTTESTDGTPFL